MDMEADLGRLKGILKKPTDSKAKAPSSNPRDLAIHHAKILQRQKDLEAEILDNVITLSEFPTVRDSQHSAASPAPKDRETFVDLVRLFQPSDYDDLIEERNVNRLCGYALCPRPRRKGNPGGSFMINAGDIVRRKDYEMWCSQACAKRALYVKVQLNETAAWERAGVADIRIELFKEEDSTESDADRTLRKLEAMKLENQRQAADVSAALALERGEQDVRPGMDRIRVDVKEKDAESSRAQQLVGPFEDIGDDHLVVEGHKTKLARRPKDM